MMEGGAGAYIACLDCIEMFGKAGCRGAILRVLRAMVFFNVPSLEAPNKLSKL